MKIIINIITVYIEIHHSKAKKIQTLNAECFEEKVVNTIGYLGDPGITGLKVYSTLLEQLFQFTYGYKRLAPSQVISSVVPNLNWRMALDSTTLGGNWLCCSCIWQ